MYEAVNCCLGGYVSSSSSFYSTNSKGFAEASSQLQLMATKNSKGGRRYREGGEEEEGKKYGAVEKLFRQGPNR